MPEFIVTPTVSVDSATGLKNRRFVQVSTNGGKLRYPKNGDPIDGVTFADSSTFSTRDIALGIQYAGVAMVEAKGSSMHVGHHVMASSVGMAIQWTTGKICVGKVVFGSSGSTGRILSVLIRHFGHSTAVT